MRVSTQAAIDRRILLSRQRRAEEQVVVAVLHASSILNFVAIIASASVWANQRSRSRFLAIQARQAMMFQIVTAIGLVITFVLFMAGFYVAMFGGLIARSGIREPGLTSALIIAAVLGGAAIVFFLILLPLAGVWAAIRILRGHNFLYPILGRRVVDWYTRKYSSGESSSPPRYSPTSSVDDNDPALVGTAHLSILVGFAPIVAAVQWASAQHRSVHLTFNLMQAALYQLCMGVGFAVAFCAYPTLGILILAMYILPIIAAIRAYSSKEFRYPILGNWLARYLGLDARGGA